MGVTITVYGRDKCGDCIEAKRVLKEAGVVYAYKDVRTGPDVEANQASVNDICRGLGMVEPRVPVVVFHNKAEDRDTYIAFVEPRGPELELLRTTAEMYKPLIVGEIG